MGCCSIIALETFGKGMLHYTNLKQIAEVVMATFPRAYKEITALLIKPRGGPLYQACVNRKRQDFPAEKKTELKPTEDAQPVIDDTEAEKLIAKLEYAVADDVTTLKLWLKATHEYRRQLLKSSKEFPEKLRFGFFWLKPAIFINYEFSLSYPGIEVDSLKYFWPKALSVLPQLMFLNKKKPVSGYPQVVAELLDFLQIVGHLPVTKPKKKTFSTDNLKTARTRLVQLFSTDTTEETILAETKSNLQPFLIAKYVGNEKKIQQYFVMFYPSLYPLPPDFTLVQAFDTLYKLMHNFSLEYPTSLQRLFRFIDQFVFKCATFSIPNNTKIAGQIENALDKLENAGFTTENQVEFLDVSSETEETFEMEAEQDLSESAEQEASKSL